MSYMNYAAFEEALQKSAEAAAPAPSRWRLPRWLVDSEFDARMERERKFNATCQDDTADERLPLRARAGMIVGLSVLAWIPFLLAGALLWG